MIALLVVLIFSSCEDVIQVDVPTEEPRLIIDAVVRVDTSIQFNAVRVKVSLTDSFFGSVPPANLQQITMNNLDNPMTGPDTPALLETEPGSGIYEKYFSTEELVRDRWFLSIRYDDTFYVGFAEFAPSVPFDNLEFGDDVLFDDNDTELKVTFTDLEERDDFYIFDFDFENYLVSEDEFYQGQQFEFSYFYDDILLEGEDLDISILGADQEFYNYMDLLIQQSEGDFGPFETPALTVRGNIFNVTDIDNIDSFDNVDNEGNFPLGYFAIVQEFKETIIVE
ncbi:MAG: DUF4249 family protein [Flavobacteriaceae bacterium]|nr:DUF4249 domain-containing protein [Bacteroidia bacterium]NND10844.1 DUF4249 family protein [Flavobacteriaceae bacterium]NNL60453.1 DUF4249 family protein [Flavobacteriaceae bacterium]RZV66490.1 MAG: DUF4249 family protein [Flavobacteriaceae bacterium]